MGDMGDIFNDLREATPQPAVPKKKPLPDLMMAAYHEAIGWNACVDAMNVAAAPKADHIPEAGEKVALAAPAVTAQGRYYDAHFATPAAPAPVAEGFDEWLEKQFEFRNYYYNPRGPGLMAVPFARRAYEAGRAQAAQPEGGAK